MFKKKEPKRAKEYKLDAPPLPSKSPSVSAGNKVPPRNYMPPYSSEEPDPSRENIPSYPGTWKPHRDVPPVPPSVDSIPSAPFDRSSFDEDEYVAPGVEVPTEEFYDDPTDSIHSNAQNTSYPQTNNFHHNSFGQFGNGGPVTPPVTPPDSPSMEDEYVAPDEVTAGHSKASNGWRAEYQQDVDPSEETYDNPDDLINPPPQLPPSNFSPARAPHSPEFSPPPALHSEFFPSNPDEQLEENYDVVPDETGGSYPVPTTPPYDTEEFYDVPDPAPGAPELDLPPPQFKPPLPVLSQNKLHDIPAKKPPVLPNKPEAVQATGISVSERSKLFGSFNAKTDTKPPLVACRGNSGFSQDRGAKKTSYPVEEPSEPLSPPQVSPAKRPIIQSKPSAPKSAAPIPVPVRLEDQVWYKGNFTRITSDPFLRAYKKNGGFIVRPSTNDGPGFYSFSIYYQGEIRHLRIRLKGNNMYSVGEEKHNELEFDSVVECVEYHRNTPLILKAGGEVCLEVLM